MDGNSKSDRLRNCVCQFLHVFYCVRPIIGMISSYRVNPATCLDRNLFGTKLQTMETNVGCCSNFCNLQIEFLIDPQFRNESNENVNSTLVLTWVSLICTPQVYNIYRDTSWPSYKLKMHKEANAFIFFPFLSITLNILKSLF